MSSNEYSALLTPDSWFRVIVLTSGRCLIAIGVVLLLTLRLDAPLRALACVLWLAGGRFEIVRLERGFDTCTAIRVYAGGRAAIRNRDGDWMPGMLASGSIVLAKLGWLRVETEDGRVFHEAVRGNNREHHDWRRLQVIMRHIGARD